MTATLSEPPGLTIPEYLFRQARERGDKVAFHVLTGGSTTSMTFDDLARRAAGYADWFSAAGVRPGAVVVLCLRHRPSLYPAYLGAMLAGAIPSFVSFPTPKQDPDLFWQAHRVLFGRVRPAAVLTYPANAAELAAVLPAGSELLLDEPGPPARGEPLAELAAAYPTSQPESVALLQHSSGTTGHKKGVMLTHRQIEIYVQAYARAQGMTVEHRVASWLPLYHDMGLISAFLGPLLLGATVVSIDAFEWVERPHLLLELMDRHQCHFTWLPNFALNHLVRTKDSTESYRLDHVVAFVCAAEPCKPEVFDRFVAAFAGHGVRAGQLVTAYGMAEMVMAVALHPPGTPPPRRYFDVTALRLGRAVAREPGPSAIGYLSNGPLIDWIEARVDPAADVPGEGTAIGELQYRGRHVFSAYYRNPDATAAAFVDGWLRSGDLGCLLDGGVYVIGRSKDVIIHYGVNYYAHDLEAVASDVAGVKPGRCAAVGLYDQDIGSERVELIVERDEERPVRDRELRRAIRCAIADRYQVTLARVHLVAPGWLIKTTSGKVSRTENLAKLALDPPAAEGIDERGGDGFDERAGELAQVVLRTIATTFDIPIRELGRHTVAKEVAGWDSLGHTLLLIRLSAALDTMIPEEVAALATNVGELIDLLTPLVGDRG